MGNKTRMRNGWANPASMAVLCVLVLSACASGPRLVVDKSPELVTFDGLHPLETAFFDRVWVRTPLDLSRFDKLFIEQAESFYRYLPQDHRAIVISDEDRAAFEARLSTSVRASLSDSSQFQLADAPGYDVLTLWGTVVDVNIHTSDGHLRVAEFILVVELRDSVTRDALVRLVHPFELLLDERDEVGNWAKIDRIAIEIGSLLRQRLDELFLGLADGIR